MESFGADAEVWRENYLFGILQNARDYTIRKDGKVPKRYVSRSGELSESVAACENGCGAYWEDEDFSIGQDGMFYDNKYTEDGQA